ncbi:hypothetical protein IE53DRAFT_236190 [Violaceomyces palustris]|uniref:Uncharacterized protein n=1 Tax=Violaceomyces palustris TaxID=1673888 RepID=A0ACD0NPD7_9BASI|nr:hypothetical protein IE53DRAFT_236190 [Violaceomyces palustris]
MTLLISPVFHPVLSSSIGPCLSISNSRPAQPKAQLFASSLSPNKQISPFLPFSEPNIRRGCIHRGFSIGPARSPPAPLSISPERGGWGEASLLDWRRGPERGGESCESREEERRKESPGSIRPMTVMICQPRSAGSCFRS